MPTNSVAGTAPAVSQPTEGISISQRMVSATCGSILTSCLGEWQSLRASMFWGSKSRVRGTNVIWMLISAINSNTPRCRSCSITVSNHYPHKRSFAVHIPFTSEPEKFAPKSWGNSMLSRGLLDGSKFRDMCDWAYFSIGLFPRSGLRSGGN